MSRIMQHDNMVDAPRFTLTVQTPLHEFDLIETAPVLGFDNEFPETLWILHHLPTNKYGCYCHNGTHGLAVFSSDFFASRFAEWIQLQGIAAVETTFDEAREIAKGRGFPVVCLLLADNPDNPVIHYIM